VTLDAGDCALGRHSEVLVDLRGDHGWALLDDPFEHGAAPASGHDHGLAVCYTAALHFPVVA
jgi:hypothetical protein